MVPEGWSLTNLGSVVRIWGGLAPSQLKLSSDGGIPYLKVEDLNNSSKYQVRSRTYVENTPRPIPARAILFPKRGAAISGNKVRIAKVPHLIDSNMMALEVNPDKTDHEFLYYKLLNEGLYRIADTSTIPQINNKHIIPYPIALPPLPEQKKIAEILSTWDKTIETTEKLLANAETQKYALAQQLLDHERWPLKRLGEIGTIRSAGVDKKVSEGELPVRLLNYLDVLRRDRIYADELDHWVTAKSRQAQECDVRKGDVFFTPSSETRDDIGHSAVAMEDIPHAVYSYHVVRLRPTVPMDLKFRAYACKSQHFYRQCYAYCEGSGQRYVISQEYFRSFTIGFPPLEQQQKIGDIFSSFDQAIKVYRRDICNLQHEKRALMQQLLTGKRRVKV